jgi:single-strand DNA-binding protein
MQGFANVQLKGMIAVEPEMKYSQGGMFIGRVRLVVNTRKKKGEEWVEHASWFDVTWFGKRAESFLGRFGKGTYITVIGKVEQRTWEDANTGQKRYGFSFIADDVYIDQFPKDYQGSIGPKDQGQRQDSSRPRPSQPYSPRPSSGPSQPAAAPSYDDHGDYDNAPDYSEAQGALPVGNPTPAGTVGDYLNDDDLPF